MPAQPVLPQVGYAHAHLIVAHIQDLELGEDRELWAHGAQGIAAEVELQQVAQGRQHALVTARSAREVVARKIEAPAAGVEGQHARDKGSVQPAWRSRAGRSGHGRRRSACTAGRHQDTQATLILVYKSVNQIYD